MLKPLIAVEIDNVICKNPLKIDDHIGMLDLEADSQVISNLYKLMEKGYRIVIYTSRKESDFHVTKDWLTANRVPYHDIVMGKLKADLYIEPNSKEALDYVTLDKIYKDIPLP